MIEKRENGYVAYCDKCSNSIDTREINFFNAINSIKDSNWRIVHNDGDFLHFCSSECRKKKAGK